MPHSDKYGYIRTARSLRKNTFMCVERLMLSKQDLASADLSIVVMLDSEIVSHSESQSSWSG